MSGPKTSRYTLTAEQRRRLEIQRQLERRRAVAKEQIKQKSLRIAQIGGVFTADSQVAEELKTRTGSDCGFTEKHAELQKVVASAKLLISALGSDNPDRLESVVASYDAAIRDAEKLTQEITRIANDNNAALHSRLGDEIAGGFITSFGNIEKKTKTVIEQSVNIDEIRQRIIQNISQLKSGTGLPDELVAALNEAQKRITEISDVTFMKNYAAVSVTPLFKRCRQALEDYERFHAELETLYAEYHALCELYAFVPQKYECTADSIAALKGEIERIGHIAAEDDEDCYIGRCLDEVMAEMGYSVIGSRDIAKKNGKHLHSELYSFGEGTAVNVTYSSNGNISMEIGGIDSSDRLPDEREAEVLCDAMLDFCSGFREIEKKLLSRGVIVGQRVSILPPTAEYAQIINTSDYDVKVNTEKFADKKQRRRLEKPKTARKE